MLVLNNTSKNNREYSSEKGILIMKKLSQSRLADTVMNGRKEKGMTQAQLADATGINRALISRIEQKDFVPSIEQLESLSEVLNFDLTEMFIKADTGWGQLLQIPPRCRVNLALKLID